MRLKTSSGRFVSYDPSKYLIDWDTPVTRGKGGRFGKRQWEVKQFLRRFWESHIIFEEFRLPQSRLSIDFFNLTMRVAIEVSGEQHIGYNEHFHNGSRINYFNQKRNDYLKREFCEMNDISMVEIFPADEINYDSFVKKGIFPQL